MGSIAIHPCNCEQEGHSPNVLHFVGLDKGTHPGLPSGVAKATRPSASTESLSHGAKTFGDSKLARQPGMCRGQAITLGYRVDSVVGTCFSRIKSDTCQIGMLLGSLESTE
jgi:hypothetical protein